MLQFLAPAGTVCIGLAMFAYGLVQSLLHSPPAASFQATAQAMPHAVAVFLFALGIAAVVVGIVLLVSGIRGVRNRTRDISRAYGSRDRTHRRSSRDEFEDEWEREMAYR